MCQKYVRKVEGWDEMRIKNHCSNVTRRWGFALLSTWKDDKPMFRLGSVFHYLQPPLSEAEKS